MSGNVVGAHLGRLIGHNEAIRQLSRRLNMDLGPADPAPWLQVDVNYGISFVPFHRTIPDHMEPDEFVRQRKVEDRVALVMARGLLSGELIAKMTDPVTGSSHDVPGWMWERFTRAEHWWWSFPMPVVLPSYWHSFENQVPMLLKSAFDSWISSAQPLILGELPVLPRPHDAATKPAQTLVRQPPHEPYLTLSEALSWIAFGYAVGREPLYRAHWEGSFGDPAAYQLKLSNAVSAFVSKAAGGDIDILGRLTSDLGQERVTRRLEPPQFLDFAQFDVECDCLRLGSGLVTSNVAGLYDAFHYGRSIDPFYRDVKVARAGLMEFFPPSRAGAVSTTATAAAETEGASWLETEFAADPGGSRPKHSFRSAALTHFKGRLSERGFNRVWSKVAPEAGRAKPGRKSVRRIDSPV